MLSETFKQFRGKDAFVDIFGQNPAKRQILSALIMNRHIVLVGPPGIGKTTFAKNVARLLPSLKANDCPYNCDPSNPVCPQCKTTKLKTKDLEGIRRFVRVQ